MHTTSSTDEQPIYPGHAVTIACQIAVTFPSFADAIRPTTAGWPEALASRAIAGAGGSVYQALALLRRIEEGQPLDEVMRWADTRWRSRCAEEGRPDGDRGCEQARRFVAAIDLPTWMFGRSAASS